MNETILLLWLFFFVMTKSSFVLRFHRASNGKSKECFEFWGIQDSLGSFSFATQKLFEFESSFWCVSRKFENYCRSEGGGGKECWAIKHMYFLYDIILSLVAGNFMIFKRKVFPYVSSPLQDTTNNSSSSLFTLLFILFFPPFNTFVVGLAFSSSLTSFRFISVVIWGRILWYLRISLAHSVVLIYI